MPTNPVISNLLDEIKKECERLTMETIEIYDVRGKSPLTDFVVVATAGHILQLDAARRTLSTITKKAGFTVQNPTEDYSEGWLVMDCVDLVIHILIEEKRAFYDLDGLMQSLNRSSSLIENEFHDDEEANDAELENIIEHLTEEELEEFLDEIEKNIQD